MWDRQIAYTRYQRYLLLADVGIDNPRERARKATFHPGGRSKIPFVAQRAYRSLPHHHSSFPQVVLDVQSRNGCQSNCRPYHARRNFPNVQNYHSKIVARLRQGRYSRRYHRSVLSRSNYMRPHNLSIVSALTVMIVEGRDNYTRPMTVEFLWIWDLATIELQPIFAVVSISW